MSAKTEAKKSAAKDTKNTRDAKKKDSSKKNDAKKSGLGSKLKFKIGDKVTWKSHGGEAKGRVEKKISDESKIAGRKVSASKDEPQYLVRSEKSGGTAVHKPKALTLARGKKGK